MAGLLENLDGQVTIDPASTTVQNIYKLLIGSIVPRPIAFVSSLSADGVRNLAPFSFFTAISANPPVICFSPMVRPRDGSHKDTLNNIRTTGEFVVNIVSEDFAERMNITSGDYGPEVDEFEISDLTPIPSDMVEPARIGESRVNLECRLVQIVDVSTKPLGGSLVLGEVLRFHVKDEAFEDFRIDPDVLKAIGRMGGQTYCRTHGRFEMPRPVV
jgi:flavin reductase (DIM6/NTAB) family NADH-FMN oxidoreductase RutF